MLSAPCANGRSNSQPSQPLRPVLEQQYCSVRQDCYSRLSGASGGAPAAPGLADGPEPRVTLQVWQLFPQRQLVWLVLVAVAASDGLSSNRNG